MEVRFSPGINEYKSLNTEQLRSAYLIDKLFTNGQVDLVYSDVDRAVIGSAVPSGSALKLQADAELRAQFFCERRELGVLNIGGAGKIRVDADTYDMAKLDCLYVPKGSREVEFHSTDPANPAVFYLLSYPAHSEYPIGHARQKDAAAVELGSSEDANQRTIYKYIHPTGIRSCQLVMGFTSLKEGCVWNTMPPHTHTRRSEIYVYFDLGQRRVMHFMGDPRETRHIIMSDRQAVISPSWSIHSGCGTGAYMFCWGMGGENQAFDDMDAAPLASLDVFGRTAPVSGAATNNYDPR